jgi:hypothetical protein
MSQMNETISPSKNSLRSRWIPVGVLLVVAAFLYTCPLFSWAVGNQSYLFLNTIPIPGEAYEKSTGASRFYTGWSTHYRIDWNAEEVVQYYEEQLRPFGWQITHHETVGTDCLSLHHLFFTSAEIRVHQGNQRSFVSISLPPNTSICPQE